MISYVTLPLNINDVERAHIVAYRGSSRVYSRHSTGKYQLDVQETGQAFAEHRSLGEELRNWGLDANRRPISGE